MSGGGTSNAIARLRADPASKWIIAGRVLDVGGGHDTLWHYRADFPLAATWTVLDADPAHRSADVEWITDDAADLPPNRTWDTIYSSHCLEHCEDPARTVAAWWAHLAPGGFLMVIVPSWYLYERGIWPSIRNFDHKTAWTTARYPYDGEPNQVESLYDVVYRVCGFAGVSDDNIRRTETTARLYRLQTLDVGFRGDAWDQTADGTCESSLEIVVQKVPR
jgi:SAM-dependent methyltransferase